MRDIGDDMRADLLRHAAGYVRDFRLIGRSDDEILRDLPGMLAGQFEGDGWDPMVMEVVAAEIRRAVERELETPARFSAEERREFRERMHAQFGDFFDDVIPDDDPA
jgi:hypothetical protein